MVFGTASPCQPYLHRCLQHLPLTVDGSAPQKKIFFGAPDNSIMVPHDRPNFLQLNINHAPMVKWISQWSSEPLWRVRVLLGAPNESNPNSLDCFFILFIKVYIKAKIKLLSFILIKHFKKNGFCSILYIKRIVYERT